jgi:flagellar hook-length control protein FliK
MQQAEQPPVVAQIRAAIEQREGAARIEVRLDPPELGRVQIEFEMRGNGQLRAVIQASEGDTLELMRRHGETLEQDLRDQGFGDLSFEWRQENEQRPTSKGGTPSAEHIPPSSSSNSTAATQAELPAGTSINLKL